MISFRVDSRSSVPPYLQLVQQVTQALRMGLLGVGDQLPAVREVVAAVVVNPNTVLKAYRDLEREGLVEARAGQSTFVRAVPPGPPPSTFSRLGRSLARWVAQAREAGLGTSGSRSEAGGAALLLHSYSCPHSYSRPLTCCVLRAGQSGLLAAGT